MDKEFSGKDIRHNAFDVAGMHFGTTGADNDPATSGNTVHISELLENAPTSFSGGVSAGQQSPVSGS